jgi:hypothetical protein
MKRILIYFRTPGLYVSDWLMGPDEVWNHSAEKLGQPFGILMRMSRESRTRYTEDSQNNADGH